MNASPNKSWAWDNTCFRFFSRVLSGFIIITVLCTTRSLLLRGAALHRVGWWPFAGVGAAPANCALLFPFTAGCGPLPRKGRGVLKPTPGLSQGEPLLCNRLRSGTSPPYQRPPLREGAGWAVPRTAHAPQPRSASPPSPDWEARGGRCSWGRRGHGAAAPPSCSRPGARVRACAGAVVAPWKAGAGWGTGARCPPWRGSVWDGGAKLVLSPGPPRWEGPSRGPQREGGVEEGNGLGGGESSEVSGRLGWALGRKGERKVVLHEQPSVVTGAGCDPEAEV